MGEEDDHRMNYCLPSANFPLQSCAVISLIAWPPPPADWATRLVAPSQGQPQVHLWAASLATSDDIIATLKATLSPDELARANRFHFERHRLRYIAGRGLLREILSRYLGAEPATLNFVYGENGKPALSANTGASNPHFNLSHSEDLALLAVSHAGPLGVDLEAVRSLEDAGELVARFFSTGENEVFQALPSAHQPHAFYNLWTRKEALLKATGAGIGRLLNRVEVSFLPEEPAQFKRLPPQIGRSSEWELHALFPGRGYTAALATQARAAKILCWRWDWEFLRGCRERSPSVGTRYSRLRRVEKRA